LSKHGKGRGGYLFGSNYTYLGWVRMGCVVGWLASCLFVSIGWMLRMRNGITIIWGGFDAKII